LVFSEKHGLEVWWTAEEQQQQGGRGRGRGRPRAPELQRSTVSPFVTDMEYHYSKENEEWEYLSATDDEAIHKEWTLEGLRLTSEIEGRIIQSYVSLRPRLGAVLLY